jgi:hypothetical protein
MFLAGLNLPGADLNSLWLARRAEYMDVFCNPESFNVISNECEGSETFLRLSAFGFALMVFNVLYQFIYHV